MFDRMEVANRPSAPRGRGAPAALLSGFVHGAVLYGAVQVTAPAEAPAEPARRDTMIFVIESRPQPRKTPRSRPTTSFPRIGRLSPPSAAHIPVHAPTSLPPIDSARLVDRADFFAPDDPGNVFDRMGGTPTPHDGGTYRVETLDEVPERLSGPSPRYPELLRQAGIEGTVWLEFVVDATGAVERETIRVTRSTNRAFEGPARAMIAGSRFRPGSIRGRNVRVLVETPVQFVIRRD